MAEVVAGLGVFGLVIAVGWLLVRLRALPANTDAVLTRVCFFAATPALLLTTVSQADLGVVTSATTVTTVACALVAVLAAGLLHRLVLRRSVAESVVGALASGYVNAANLGIPVTVLVLGGTTAITPVLLLQLLVITPVVFLVLDTVTRRGSPSRLATLTVPLRNPLLWAVAAGVGLNVAGWDLHGTAGGYLAQLLDMLGRVAVPLMMLSLGASLAGAPRPLRPRSSAPSRPQAPGAQGGGDGGTGDGGSERAGSRDPRAGSAALWWAVGWKLVVMPVTAAVLGLAAGLEGRELLVPVVTASLPTAQNVFMYASRYGVATDLARDAVLLTTAGFVPVVLLEAALLG
ncbi:AEC family transporter [Actinomyces wuliandei]|uniref:AEC family transporter n=1 Tax=Actinomyces wuliandei TaxID=2057743 RepID=UPI000FD73778|nr:AEC family transporter [Actinomyces wuliandei]